jgi:putative peptidoglycan lipid II flippase
MDSSSISNPRRSGGGATRVALGIFSSRVFGLIREASLGFFFGAGPHADVFRTALRGPNVLQNLLGEQTLSVSFIPVYARMLEENKEEEAGRFAGAMFGLLMALAAGLALTGILLAKPIVALLAPGFLGDAAQVAAGTADVDRYPLAVAAVRFIFPMTGLLVLSAWAMGVLNSHRRFFLPYFAPVVWNAAIIAALWLVGGQWSEQFRGGAAQISQSALDQILLAACAGALVGGLLQFLVQIPLVVKVLKGFRPSLSTRVPGVRAALRAFTPLAAGRGVVQLSSYLDIVLASLLAAGAPAALGYAQTLYILPVSLFGMSVAAAELPELSRRSGPDEGAEILPRVDAGLRQTAFLTLPTFLGYLLFGFLLVAFLYRRGSFQEVDSWLVYLVLCGYTLGLPATNSSRQLNNVFYSLGKTAIPAKIAVARVSLSVGLGIPLMLWLDRYTVAQVVGLGHAERQLYLGALGLALGAGVASWFELWRLRRALRREVPGFELPWRRFGGFLFAAVVAAVPAFILWWFFPPLLRLPRGLVWMLEAVVVLTVYGTGYLAVTGKLEISELDRWMGRSSRK